MDSSASPPRGVGPAPGLGLLPITVADADTGTDHVNKAADTINITSPSRSSSSASLNPPPPQSVINGGEQQEKNCTASAAATFHQPATTLDLDLDPEIRRAVALFSQAHGLPESKSGPRHVHLQPKHFWQLLELLSSGSHPEISEACANVRHVLFSRAHDKRKIND